MFANRPFLGIRVPTPGLVIALAPLCGCAALQDMTAIGGAGSVDPSTGEMVGGLKQALSKGAAQAVANLAQEGGYARDSLVRIAFPEEAGFVADALERIGMESLVESFEQRLNEGAEAGAKRALPIFEDAIRQMSFADAKQILLGGEHAATDYFHQATYDSLVSEFRPEMEGALDQLGAIGLWTEISTQYNRIPFTSKKVETDIVHYATDRALDGLFLKLAAQEARIRTDPVARTTALLQKVFGYAAQKA